MSSNRLGVAARDFLREVARKLAREIGVVRNGRVEQIMIKRKFRVGQQHRQLRPRQRLSATVALRELHVVGQELDRAVEQAPPFERLHQSLLETEILEAASLRQRNRL